MSHSQSSVMKIYQSVIEDVISGVRDSFLDEGVDEQVLQELKQIWESKLESSKAIEVNPDPPEPQSAQFLSQNDSSRNNTAVRTGQIGNNIYTYQSTQNAAQNMTQQSNQVAQAASRPHVQSSQNQSTQQIQPQSQQQSQSQLQSQQHQQQQQTQQPQHTPTSLSLPTQTVIVADPNKQVPIQLTLQGQGGGERVLTIQVPASALHGNQLQQILTGPLISASMALPVNLASSLLQQHVTAAFQSQVAAATAAQLQPVSTIQQAATNQQQNQTGTIRQLDGALDTSDEDEEEDDEDNDDEDENEENEEDENEEDAVEGQEEEPLNSEDDVSDEDPTDLFDTDNVVVCQYDKITRSRNKWKFYLKDGIMNLNGKDFVFQKASGDAEW